MYCYIPVSELEKSQRGDTHWSEVTDKEKEGKELGARSDLPKKPGARLSLVLALDRHRCGCSSRNAILSLLQDAVFEP